MISFYEFNPIIKLSECSVLGYSVSPHYVNRCGIKSNIHDNKSFKQRLRFLSCLKFDGILNQDAFYFLEASILELLHNYQFIIKLSFKINIAITIVDISLLKQNRLIPSRVIDCFQTLKSFGVFICMAADGILLSHETNWIKTISFDGIRINANILYRYSQRPKDYINICNMYKALTPLIISDGVHNRKLCEVASLGGAEFMQGTYWPSYYRHPSCIAAEKST